MTVPRDPRITRVTAPAGRTVTPVAPRPGTMGGMSATDPLTSGWLHGCSLASFVLEHASVLAEIPIAVVTMVDSSAEVSRMPLGVAVD